MDEEQKKAVQQALEELKKSLQNAPRDPNYKLQFTPRPTMIMRSYKMDACGNRIEDQIVLE